MEVCTEGPNGSEKALDPQGTERWAGSSRNERTPRTLLPRQTRAGWKKVAWKSMGRLYLFWR